MYFNREKMYTKLTIFLIVVLAVSINLDQSSALSPNKVTKCNSGNNDCIRDNINFLISNDFSGDVSIGIPAIDPYYIDAIIVPSVFNLTNVYLYGFRDAVVTSCR